MVCKLQIFCAFSVVCKAIANFDFEYQPRKIFVCKNFLVIVVYTSKSTRPSDVQIW